MCWSSVEQAYCGELFVWYAVWWVAKEVAMKVLGYGIGEVDLFDIEVVFVEGQ